VLAAATDGKHGNVICYCKTALSRNSAMKLTKLFFFLILTLNISNAQIDYNKLSLSESQKKFVKESSPEFKIYFLSDKNILIAYSEDYLRIISNEKKYDFDLKAYSESYLKFNILNRKKVIGRFFVVNNGENYTIEIYDNKTIKKLGFEIIKLSNKIEVKSL